MAQKSRLDAVRDSLYSRSYTPEPDTRTPLSERIPSPQSKWGETKETLAELVRKEPPRESTMSLIHKLFIGSLLFFVLAVIFAGIVLIRGGTSVTSRNIDITVEGPTTVAAGAPFTQTVRVVNRNSRALEGTVLRVTYPEGARNFENQEERLTSQTIRLDTLTSGQQEILPVKYVLYGEKGSVGEIKVVLEYRVEGSSAVFEKETRSQIAIGFTPLVLTAEYRRELQAGEDAEFRLEITSNSAEPLTNLILTAEYPFGFRFLESDPQPFSSAQVFRIGDIPPGGKKTITLRGSLEAQDEEERTFRFVVGVAKESGSGTVDSVIAQTTETVKLARPFVSLLAYLDGKSDNEISVKPGDRIQYELTWKNNLPTNLERARIVVSLGGIFDPATVIVRNGGFYRSTRNSVEWTSESLPELRDIAPGDTGSVSLSVGIPSIIGRDIRNQSLTLTATLQGLTQSDDRDIEITQSIIRTARLRSLPVVRAFSTRAGTLTHSGPIPPRAETETTYSGVFSLSNAFADATGVVVKGVLPPWVVWKGATAPQSERIVYDEATRTITWNVGELPAGTGSGGKNRQVEFSLGITPSVSQIGSSPILVQDISVTGSDRFSGSSISLTAESITTRLEDAGFIPGNETVVNRGTGR